jgi:hypothetical protein
MKLTKPMIKIFARIAKGVRTIEGLKEAEHKSGNWITEVLQELEKEGFIIKKRNYSLRGSRIAIEIANTSHAQKFKETLFQYPTIRFEEILADSRLLFLAALSEDWINTKTAAKLSRVSRYIIDRNRPKLKNRGVIIKKNGLYKINERAWPLLKDFLIAYKNYSTIQGYVKWKFNDEIIFEVDSEKLVQGSITGFARYCEYGVKINTIHILCKLPESKLSKEEIFVHSLFEINDPRTLYLSLVFYLKNKLDKKKINPIAMKYSRYTMFNNFLKILKSDKNISIEGLPNFERKDFNRVAGLYGVKNV